MKLVNYSVGQGNVTFLRKKDREFQITYRVPILCLSCYIVMQALLFFQFFFSKIQKLDS